MDFDLVWQKGARRSLRKMPSDIARRIVRKMKMVQINPFRYLESLAGRDSFKLRVGNYRAIIDADLSNRLLIVRIIDKRGRVYKR